MNNNLNELEEILGVKFNNQDLLLQAVTHSSYANEVLSDAKRDNERLEFLGDAVLDMVISNILFKDESDIAEGDLTKQRASIVCERALAKLGKSLGVNEFMLFGHGEERSGGRNRDSIVADCMESIIGAIYIDQGFTSAGEFVGRFFKETIEDAKAGKFPRDSKTELQERMQAQGSCNIEYRLLAEEGPDHDKRFLMGVYINGEEKGKGFGKSKKEAQQIAAETALRGL